MSVIKNGGKLFVGTELEISELSYYFLEDELKEINRGRSVGNLWKLERDFTLEDNPTDFFPSYGGEYISPKYDLLDSNMSEDLSFILDMLYKNGARPCERSSNHIHFNADYFANDVSWVNLIEVWLAYEPIIYRFGYDNEIMGRNSMFLWAKPLSTNRDSYLRFIDFCRREKLCLEEVKGVLKGNDFNLFRRNYGLNLNGMIYDSESRSERNRYSDGKIRHSTIEFRNCDMVYDSEIVMSRIDMYSRLLGAIKNNRFDMEYLRHRNLKPYFNTPDIVEINDFKSLYSKIAREFADVLYDGDCEKRNFMKVYTK